jgi:hypothetical protein
MFTGIHCGLSYLNHTSGGFLAEGWNFGGGASNGMGELALL